MDQIRLKAYAKVNLTLDVVGRREDGYHRLRSIMQSVSLADTITLQKHADGIVIQTSDPQIPTNENNICWQAVRAFQSYTKVVGGVQMMLEKEIPVGAGLGGGSADAAAVLHGLNQLYATELQVEQLQEIGLSVGADVPFCLQGGTCLVEGIGEAVTPLQPFPAATFVLVKPRATISTAEVYTRLAPSAYGGASTTRFMERLAENQGVPALSRVFANALESVTMSLVPEIADWKERLLAFGAHQALMSGSGPTVFGLFSDAKRAQAFRHVAQTDAQIMVVEPMDTGVSERNGGDRVL